MSLKIVSVVATLCLVQSLAAANPLDSLDQSLRGTLLVTVNTVNTLQNAVVATRQRVHDVAQQVAQLGDDQLRSSRVQIQALARHVAAQGDGGDLASCTEDQNKAIAELVQRVEGEVYTCVVAQVTEIGVVVADVAARANEAVQVLQVSIANISTCLERPLFAPQCILDVKNAAEEEADLIIAALAVDLQAAEDILESAPEEISKCATEKLNAASEDAGQIIVDIAQCIVDGSTETTEGIPTEASV